MGEAKCNHEFTPRFDHIMDEKSLETLAQILPLMIKSHESIEAIINAAKSRVYIRDICRFCGTYKDRPEGMVNTFHTGEKP
jgi:hypothetical protein